MIRRILGGNIGGAPYLINPTVVLDKEIDFAVKFGITITSYARNFSRDYQYFFMFTSGGAEPHHTFNVVDINDINTWTLYQTWGSGDYRGGYISNDGKKAYGGVTSLAQRNTTTPYNFSTTTNGGSLAVGGTGFIGGVYMNPDETKLFVEMYDSTPIIREFDLVTPGNITGATFVQEKALLPATLNEKGCKFINEGNAILTAYLQGTTPPGAAIRQVTTPYTLNGLTDAQPISNNLPGQNSDIEINADYSKIYTILVDGKVRQYSIL